MFLLAATASPCTRLQRAESERDSELRLTLVACFKQRKMLSWQSRSLSDPRPGMPFQR